MAKDNITNIKQEAEQAVKLEKEVNSAENSGFYTHTFKKPFTFQGKTAESLHFDWESLTGRDYNAIESDLLRAGVTLIVPAYTGQFLMGMAVRACTDKDTNGARIVDNDFIQALPLKDYQTIIGKARTFLIQSERAPSKAGSGSKL